MFIGTSLHSIDSKGRIVLPPRFRQELGEVFYITKGIGEDCVQVLSKENFESMCKQIALRPLDKQKPVHREFCSFASEVSPNAQGRILISPVLRKKAELDGDVMVVGVYDCVEIWNIEKFEEAQSRDQSVVLEAMTEINS